MFRHDQPQGRQVKDLPPLLGQAACALTERSPTDRTPRRLVGDEPVRDGDLGERRAWMTRLSTGLSGGGLTQRARLFGQTITRWRLVARTAIARQLVFQLFDSCTQLRDLRLLLLNQSIQLLNQRDHRLWPLAIDSLDLLTGQHRVSLLKVSCPVCLLAHRHRG